MKQKPEHLSKMKRDELKRIVSVIRKKCGDVEMIILFGSYARGNFKVKADLSADHKSGHVSDYDILVVTGQKETVDNVNLWSDVTKACNSLGLSAYTRIITHDIQELNIKLAEGQYFFSDIKKEGYILFGSGDIKLADERELTPKEKQRIAQDHFDHWFERARDFYYSDRDNLNADRVKISAFDLHQVSESCYKTVLLVFTSYNPNEHWLASLSDMVVQEVSSFDKIFPIRTEEEKERFKLLDYAYIGARYDPKYQISKKDLELLAVSVKKLLEHTEKVCKQKIESFAEKR